ncbi:hypothetical protein P5673_006158 [Acropora cervicornis]|uniref:Uncharacterized protein n=1 Tax=Acropora cervicornis TaxID=6130 RepID=A0AAD9VCC7_ACRCE|nr:hypothetical protein P5673_006158 [Acropora cervicornis]
MAETKEVNKRSGYISTNYLTGAWNNGIIEYDKSHVCIACLTNTVLYELTVTEPGRCPDELEGLIRDADVGRCLVDIALEGLSYLAALTAEPEFAKGPNDEWP